MQFLHPQFLAQQSMMSSWPFHPPFFPAWPNIAQIPFASPTIEPMVNNNDVYLSTNYKAEIPERMKMLTLSPISHSTSPTSRQNDSIEIAKAPIRKKKVYECKLCDKTFGYKHVLQNHEKIHSGEKGYRCEQCNKRFRRDHHLKVHMRLHSGEKPYSCDFPMCNRDFVQVANLRRHLKTHEHGDLKIHKKMLVSEKKENLWPLNSENSDGSVQSSGSSQDHEDYDSRAYKSIDFAYEEPEQSMPEDLSTKSNVRNTGNWA